MASACVDISRCQVAQALIIKLLVIMYLRRPRHGLRDHQARNSSPARCGSSGFDAIAQAYLASADDMVRHVCVTCLCLPGSQPDPQKCSKVRCPIADGGDERHLSDRVLFLPPRFTLDLIGMFVSRSIRPCTHSHLLSPQGLR